MGSDGDAGGAVVVADSPMQMLQEGEHDQILEDQTDMPHDNLVADAVVGISTAELLPNCLHRRVELAPSPNWMHSCSSIRWPKEQSWRAALAPDSPAASS